MSQECLTLSLHITEQAVRKLFCLAGCQCCETSIVVTDETVYYNIQGLLCRTRRSNCCLSGAWCICQTPDIELYKSMNPDLL